MTAVKPDPFKVPQPPQRSNRLKPPLPVASNPKAADSPAQRILDWKERFKTMRVYFDGLDPKVADSLRMKIRHLGAVSVAD